MVPADPYHARRQAMMAHADLAHADHHQMIIAVRKPARILFLRQYQSRQCQAYVALNHASLKRLEECPQPRFEHRETRLMVLEQNIVIRR